MGKYLTAVLLMNYHGCWFFGVAVWWRYVFNASYTPKTGEHVDGSADEDRTWIWDVEKVIALVTDQNHAATFFCGSFRNSDRFIDLFDEVFVLDIDLHTLNRRLAARSEDEWGGTASEGKTFARLQHKTKKGLPENGILVDATVPLSSVVDTILKIANQLSP